MHFVFAFSVQTVKTDVGTLESGSAQGFFPPRLFIFPPPQPLYARLRWFSLRLQIEVDSLISVTVEPNVLEPAEE